MLKEMKKTFRCRAVAIFTSLPGEGAKFLRIAVYLCSNVFILPWLLFRPAFAIYERIMINGASSIVIPRNACHLTAGVGIESWIVSHSIFLNKIP